MEALLEIGCIFGQAQLEKAAHLHSEFECIPCERTDFNNVIIGRVISTTVPGLANSPDSLVELVCKLNPKIWEPPTMRATPVEAKAHIRAVDSALDLLKRLLHMDPTKRYTSHQALMHGFLQDDLSPDEKEKEEVLHAPGEGACKDFHWVNEEGIRESNAPLPGASANYLAYRLCDGGTPAAHHAMGTGHGCRRQTYV
jgi:cell division control protein 7